jgi:outer membrane protein assembly factor BamB
MWRKLPVVLLFLGVTGSAHAQPPPLEKRVVLVGESLQVGNRLKALERQVVPLASATEVAKFIACSAPALPWRAVGGLLLENAALEKWERLLDDYQKILDESGDVLVATSPQLSVQARRLVQRRIAALPPALLQRYRQRVDAQSQKLLAQGKEMRSPTPLRQLVNDFFCSRYTDEALDLLGDLAFEQGETENALGWWRMLVAPPLEQDQPAKVELRYPDPRIDLARVQAKEVLAYAFLHQSERARMECAALRRLHPKARGALAGGKGFYVDILETWLDRLATHQGTSNQEPWTTFAGNPARNRALAVCPPVSLWVDGPAWHVPLPTPPKLAPGENMPRLNPATGLAYHPLVVDNQVLLADARNVLGYGLFPENGKAKKLFHFTLQEPGEHEDNGGTRRGHQDQRFTLTAWKNRVFARLGGQSLGAKIGDGREFAPSFLVCLDLLSEKPGQLLWKIPALTPRDAAAFFEGAPLVEEGRVYSAISWVDAQRVHTALICFDALTAKRLWWREVCETGEFEENRAPRSRQHLLTLGGGTLYYCSHSGAVVALDPWSGQYLWSARYPARGPRPDEVSVSPRDLAPCIYADNRLYLAPRDLDRILCLDAATGRLLWEREGIEVVHLLGVTRGRVYFTTPRGLQCIDNGDPEGANPRSTWLQPAEGKLPGLGRGLLAGSWLLWPTQDPKLPLRGVTLADGEQERFAIDKKASAEPEFLEPTMLRAILPGNMAFGQGCLAVAGLDELAVYVPQKFFLKDRAKDLHQTKANPLALYQLAMAQADAGLKDDATKSFERLRDTAATANWKGLSRQRLAELNGVRPHSGMISVKGAEVPVSLVPDKRDSEDLRLPLQKTMEIAIKAAAPARPTWFFLHDNEPRAQADPFFPANFRRNSRYIFFMMDQRQLVAQDAIDEQTAWTFWAPGGKIMPLADGGRFYPHYYAGDRFVLLQTTSGKTLALDSMTGKQLPFFDRPGPPWPHDPFALDDHRLILTQEGGKVSLVDVAARKIVWTFVPAGYTSLTGAPSQVFGKMDQLLVLVPRNIGPELVRLRPETGTPLWSVPILPEEFEVKTAACDAAAVFFASGKTMQARALRDGKLIWQKPLPSGTCRDWQFQRAGPALLAYPRQEKLAREVLVIDPHTGQWMQRLPLPDGIGSITVSVKGEGLLVSVKDKAWVFEQSR